MRAAARRGVVAAAARGAAIFSSVFLSAVTVGTTWADGRRWCPAAVDLTPESERWTLDAPE